MDGGKEGLRRSCGWMTAFLLIGFLSYVNIKKLVKTAGWVTHTHEVLGANEHFCRS